MSQDNNGSTKSSKAFSFDDYIDKDIFELIDAKDMPEKQRVDLLNKMMETIERRVITEVALLVPEDKTDEMIKIVEAKDKDKYLQFMKDNNIDLEKIYAEQALIYKVEMVDLIKGSNNG